jgi:predicted SprT family Zn-dependent metalloprotease
MEVIWFKNVKTRKEHKCWGCAETIPAGTNVVKTTTVNDGRIGDAYWCEKCHDAVKKMEPWEREDGFAFGEVGERLKEAAR